MTATAFVRWMWVEPPFDAPTTIRLDTLYPDSAFSRGLYPGYGQKYAWLMIEQGDSADAVAQKMRDALSRLRQTLNEIGAREDECLAPPYLAGCERLTNQVHETAIRVARAQGLPERPIEWQPS